MERSWLAFFVLFVTQEFEKCLKENGSYGGLSEETIKDASKRAHVSTNEQLHATAFDDTLSGTTAITLLLKVLLIPSDHDRMPLSASATP